MEDRVAAKGALWVDVVDVKWRVASHAGSVGLSVAFYAGFVGAGDFIEGFEFPAGGEEYEEEEENNFPRH
jgi:hypothetical protein